ncbi:hypothetical protein [Psychromonas sp. Urea-02u-13]|uniref:hypothetical protein n=1 Tax=Psychromonas sp. Urea-02u-13 TaxID=2058326 RepID=UPI000C32FE95|nr:hypothetical protein [Psychromonas sp. Urea-02u-13]PKG39434.1 hypothetical protein CXF74_08345 [Psychromonas sp. Urea-02u-13]
MSDIYYNVSNMQIKLPSSAINTDQKESITIEEESSKKTDKSTDKSTEKDDISLSIKAQKSYQASLKEAEESLPIPVKLLKAQLARLQQRLVDIKQEIDDIKADNRLNDEDKNTQLAIKQNDISNVMSAIQSVNVALLEAMKPPPEG